MLDVEVLMQFFILFFFKSCEFKITFEPSNKIQNFLLLNCLLSNALSTGWNGWKSLSPGRRSVCTPTC